MDSLKQLLRSKLDDSVRCSILSDLAETAPDGEWENYNSESKKLAEKKLATVSASHRRFYLSRLATATANEGFIAEQKGNWSKARELYEQSMKMSEEVGDKNSVATVLNNLGVVYEKEGQISKALTLYQKSVEIKTPLGDKPGLARSFNNIANIYVNLGNVALAIETHEKSLKISEEIKDERGMALSYHNLGSVYKNQDDLHKALEYFNKSLMLDQKTGDVSGMGYDLNSIGETYRELGQTDKAIEFFTKSLNLRKQNGEIADAALNLNNIGMIFKAKGDLEKALDYFRQSLTTAEGISDKSLMGNVLVNIGTILVDQKKYSEGIRYGTKALGIAKELGYPVTITLSASLLARANKETGNYKAAFENYQLFVRMRDSTNNEKTKKASIKSQLKYEYEKRATADSVTRAKENQIASAELQKKQAEIKVKKNQQYALFGGLGLVIIFGGFIFNRFRVAQRQKTTIELQKNEVEMQKKLVEEKQKEVLDSIMYARRIQMALIPKENRVGKMLDRLSG